MDASDPDVAARGRALFEQLRAEREGAVTGSSTAGTPLPAGRDNASPLTEGDGPETGNGTVPAAEFMGAGNGSEIRSEANHEIGSDRESGERGPVEGDPAVAAPLAVSAAAGGEQGDTPARERGDTAAGEHAHTGAGEQGHTAAGEQGHTAAGEQGDHPADDRAGDDAAVGGLAEDDRRPGGTTAVIDPADPIEVSTEDPAGDPPGHEEDDQTGAADADPAPPASAADGPDTFHVEHTHSDAAAATATDAAAQDPAPPPPSPPVSEGRVRHPAADLALPRIIAVANQKGGVGKTTTAVNLGAALAELGFRTLVVDLDPQGNATTGLGINARNLDSSIYDVLMHEMPIDDCIEPTSVRNLFVAPATIDLAGAEIELVPAFSRELRLKRALAEVADAYEFTIIDCPPSLGLLTVNGLAAATEVIVPIQCEYYALEGLGQLMRNVNLVQSNLNPTLLLSAIILTMYDARTKLADQVATEVRDHFGARVCRNVVPRTVRLSEAPSFGQPIIVFDPSSRGALAYRELAKEVSGGAPQRVG